MDSSDTGHVWPSDIYDDIVWSLPVSGFDPSVTGCPFMVLMIHTPPVFFVCTEPSL